VVTKTLLVLSSTLPPWRRVDDLLAGDVMSLLAAFISLCFAVWLILTVLHQLPDEWVPVLRAIKKANRLHLIPRWNFFAPTPGTSDYHIFVRSFDASQSPGAWYEFNPLCNRGWATAFWNPSKRFRKTVIDMVQITTKVVSQNEQAASTLAITVPYLSLLNVLSAHCRSRGASACQFAIIKTEGPDQVREGELLLRSDVHSCAG
jgi:hypothetical protein